MKSLGLNYTFQTLIVIDKTPVARTNDGRLAPLQAALQEEKERDFKSTMESEARKRGSFKSFPCTFLLIVRASAPLKTSVSLLGLLTVSLCCSRRSWGVRTKALLCYLGENIHLLSINRAADGSKGKQKDLA